VIGQLLPAPVVGVEAFDDAQPAPLYPAEEALVARAVAKRRTEFATGRRCARAALARLGRTPGPLLTGERGAPLWPDGVVGSITHTDGYRAAIVADRREVATVGLDAEPNLPLPKGVGRLVASASETAAVAALSARQPDICWDRLLFCVKESTYKAWFPVSGEWLDFEEADVSLGAGTFEVRLLRTAHFPNGRPLSGFSGRWLFERGLLLAVITAPAVGEETVSSPDHPGTNGSMTTPANPI
jgi:4'-phosphopantetheinyl transferase EntD